MVKKQTWPLELYGILVILYDQDIFFIRV